MPVKRNTVPRFCEHCHEPFLARTDLVKIGKGQFCSRHCATIAQRDGDRARSFAEFWSHVDKPDGDDACWTWTRARDGNGYGRFLEFPVHRYTFELAYGPIPKGMSVCHTCDNPACCRNDDEGWHEINGVLRPRRGHLWLGTPTENMLDREMKGRGNVARGEKQGHAKLTWEAVRAIRAAHELGATQTALALQYGMSVMAINDVVRHLSWVERP